MKLHIASALLVALLTSPSAWAGFITFESAGSSPLAIEATRDAFRAAVGGGTIAGPNGSFGGVRREINWDGVPDALADPNGLPANFFNVNSPRGVVFSTPGTERLYSGVAKRTASQRAMSVRNAVQRSGGVSSSASSL